MTYKITALYKFFDNSDPVEFKRKLKELCQEFRVTGMLIVAKEGMNGTVAAESDDMDRFLPQLFQLEASLTGLEIKFSFSDTQPFYRMRVCIKNEIVTLGVEGYQVHDSDIVQDVDPHDWNNVIARDDVVLVDTRNDYEVALGTFEGAIDPQTKSFKEFPEFIKRIYNSESEMGSSVSAEQSESISAPKKSLAMFCTGGIRCDKVSALVADSSKYERIYRLKGGILKYLEDIPTQDSKWKGECFVFDQRVTVTHGLVPGQCELCRGCRHPLTTEERSREDYKEGIHCKYCITTITDQKLQSNAERHLQIQLSNKRNQAHLGYKHNAHQKKKTFDIANTACCEDTPHDEVV